MTPQQMNQSIPYPQLHDLEQGRRNQDRGVWGESYKPLWGDQPMEIRVRVPSADPRRGVWTPR
jgi:hypothetical protein